MQFAVVAIAYLHQQSLHLISSRKEAYKKSIINVSILSMVVWLSIICSVLCCLCLFPFFLLLSPRVLAPQTSVRTTESQLKRTSCGKQTRSCRVVLHSVDSVSDRDARYASSVGCIAILFTNIFQNMNGQSVNFKRRQRVRSKTTYEKNNSRENGTKNYQPTSSNILVATIALTIVKAIKVSLCSEVVVSETTETAAGGNDVALEIQGADSPAFIAGLGLMDKT